MYFTYKDSVFGGLQGLRIKRDNKWEPLRNLTVGAPHPGNWLREPPLELADRVWLGLVPTDLRQRMSPDGPTPRKGMRRRMGRATLSIVKGVWGEYACKLAAWKIEVGLTPHAEECKVQRRARAKIKKMRENRERECG